MMKVSDPAVATTLACSACMSPDPARVHDATAATPTIAHEIANGSDLGGIVDLSSAVVNARVAAAAPGDPPTTAALKAAATVMAKLRGVVAEFERLGVSMREPSYCPACEIATKLAPLIHTAATAVARRELAIAEGNTVAETEELADAVHQLADYAGDNGYSAAATRTLLGLATNVFIRAAERR